MSLLANWKEVLDTANLSPEREMDSVSKWLIITRAAVFTMTATSALVGGLLAIIVVGGIDWLNFGLAFLGLIIAHAANNMNNDFFDMTAGIDTDDYARAQYAPHPVLSGLVSKNTLGRAILLFNLLDAAILVVLFLRTDWQVLVFAIAGLFISVFYVAPPFRLKHRGLGELGVLLVWGPLMIGGTYFVAAGALPTTAIWLATIPYALAVATVLMGKHIDKLDADQQLGIKTLPVIMGEKLSLQANMAFMILFYIVVAVLIFAGTLSVWMSLVLVAIPRLIQVLKIYRDPKPAEPPEDYPVWPLWFVSAAFYHNKLAGGMFLLGLLLSIIFPWTISV